MPGKRGWRIEWVRALSTHRADILCLDDAKKQNKNSDCTNVALQRLRCTYEAAIRLLGPKWTQLKQPSKKVKIA